MNNNGIYKGTDKNLSAGQGAGGDDMAPTLFVKDARYDLMMQAFGGVGVTVKTPVELDAAISAAFSSRKPTLINAVIDETAGTESGRITSLNPTAAKKA
jgi:oxalyl-CoA decarboxylase